MGLISWLLHKMFGEKKRNSDGYRPFDDDDDDYGVRHTVLSNPVLKLSEQESRSADPENL